MNNSILRQIPSEAKIKKELRKNLFGKHVFCPRCGSGQIKKYGKRLHCKSCRKHFSLTSVSWLKSAKLPLTTIWLLMWCWTNKAPVDQAGKLSGVSEVTTRRWYEKFRNHLPKDKLEDVRLEGVVMMDEAYRGSKNSKYSFVGAKQKAENGKRKKMSIRVLHKGSVDKHDAVKFISQYIIPKSQFNTDGSAIYRNIENYWPLNHQSEIHKKWEFELTSEIEGLWGNLTTFIRRMYHHVTQDKVESLVQEFVARTMYPEWFYTPSSFLKVSLGRVRKPKRPEWRGQYQRTKKWINSIHPQKTKIEFILPQKSLDFVPSC